MERLISDASRLDKSVEANSLSFDNIVRAIHAVQVEMDISGISYDEYVKLVSSGAMTQEEAFELLGTTAKEASSTIEGSFNTLKASWQNLLTGIADKDADFGALIDNVVVSAETAFKNLLPVVEKSLGGIADLVVGLAPVIIEKLPSIIERILPPLLGGATQLVMAVVEVLPELLNTVVDAIIDNAPMLLDSAFVLVGELVNGVLNQLPQIVQLGLDLIVSLANGIAESLPTLIPTIVDVILQIVDTLTDPQNLSNILQAALVLITNLAWGIVNSIPSLIDSVFAVVEGIITFLHDPANLAMLVQSAIELVIAIGLGLVQAIPKLMTSVGKLITNIVSYFFNYDWGSLGRNLVDGFKRGIQNAWYNLKSWFRNLFGDLIYIAKRILGIASPSKVFKKIGGFTAEGFGDGFDDEFSTVRSDMEKALSFDDVSVGINSSIKRTSDISGSSSGAGGTMAELDSIRRDISFIASVLMNGITLDANDRELGRFIRRYATT